ncbi:MAG: Bcr/CflA family multidrug efflux MFS transporter [Enterobacteriaceae bacterium]
MAASFSSTPPRWLIPLLGSLVAFGPLSIDMYLPALPAIAQQMGASQGEMQLSLGTFMVGFCVGMLLYGPLSDRLGRRRLLLGGLSLFVVASVLCALVTNVWLFIALRAIQALGSGAAVVMGRAIARDVFPHSELPRVLSLMTLVTMAAPLLAPSIGGLLLMLFDWQSIFWSLALIGLFSMSLLYLRMPETLNQQHAAASVLQAFHNYCLLMRDGQTMALIATLAFTFAGMFAFISGSPFVYIDYFAVPVAWYGMLFSSNVVGMIVMLMINVRLLHKVRIERLLAWQTLAQMLFGLLLLLGYQQPLSLFVLLVILFVSLVNAIGTNCLSLLLQYHGRRAGSASALAISCQFAAAAIANLLVAGFHSNSPLPMVAVMAACGVLSCLSLRTMLWLQRKNPSPDYSGEKG